MRIAPTATRSEFDHALMEHSYHQIQSALENYESSGETAGITRLLQRHLLARATKGGLKIGEDAIELRYWRDDIVEREEYINEELDCLTNNWWLTLIGYTRGFDFTRNVLDYLGEHTYSCLGSAAAEVGAETFNSLNVHVGFEAVEGMLLPRIVIPTAALSPLKTIKQKIAPAKAVASMLEWFINRNLRSHFAQMLGSRDRLQDDAYREGFAEVLQRARISSLSKQVNYLVNVIDGKLTFTPTEDAAPPHTLTFYRA
jgi:hypothetical protein